MALTVRMLIGIGETHRVDLKSVAQTFSKEAKMVHAERRDERAVGRVVAHFF